MKKKEAIEVLSSLAGQTRFVQPSITLVNQATGETLNPDPAALKAGIIAGLVTGKAVLDIDVPAEHGVDFRGTVAEIMAQAANTYLSLILDDESDGTKNA